MDGFLLLPLHWGGEVRAAVDGWRQDSVEDWRCSYLCIARRSPSPQLCPPSALYTALCGSCFSKSPSLNPSFARLRSRSIQYLITVPRFLLSALDQFYSSSQYIRPSCCNMSLGRIHCFLVATKGSDVIYERFYDRLSEAEKAEVRGCIGMPPPACTGTYSGGACMGRRRRRCAPSSRDAISHVHIVAGHAWGGMRP